MADLKSLEHPTLKVPYEILNKKFRAAQKNIDREVSHIQIDANELESCLKKNAPLGDVSRVLDGVVEKLTIMKRKAEESILDEVQAARVCKRRIEHLKDYETLSPTAANQWQKKRLDRMLVEYFLRAGYYSSAIKLANQSNIEDLINIELFLVAKEVEDTLAKGDTSKCLAWFHDNKSKLRKMQSTLEFNLREQEFIELVRANRRLDAVKHARKYFVDLNDNQLCGVQKAMGLLAYPVNTEVPAYKELLEPSRWQRLVQQFRQENFKVYQLNSHSVFTVTLQAGLSALKTPQCYKDDGLSKNPECPVCSSHMNRLARKLPFAHSAQSKLICSISGRPLNEHNPPLMLPNGHVYGCDSLHEMAEEHEGRIVCPRTKQIFTLDEVEKVYVM
ncbi:hypothetical protein CAPTEDRAFT_123183 [Capitella teleta]|uniref:E3 ubiquitin-protein transferase MAEA n=1 Tax=Capitella teleta TaxID=283909 RepID=R7ULR9_CAPTE|nr:hypothetical protein CAPTEDRAFT_123183 [Capitella teleta]|eukprot:ELU07028.1 hypothetical protein CAPTEDRAFT_123183 [Capitella teleta]